MGDVFNHLVGFARRLPEEDRSSCFDVLLGCAENAPALTTEYPEYVDVSAAPSLNSRQRCALDTLGVVQQNFDVATLRRDISQERVAQAKRQERQRLAAELHDDICQQVVALKITAQLLAADESLAATAVNSAQGLVNGLDHLLGSVRDVVSGLDARLPGGLSLRAALHQLMEQMLVAQGLRVEFNGSGDIDQYSRVINLGVYRIVQEAFTNIVRHAQADNVCVTVVASYCGIKLELRDNGRGYALVANCGSLSGSGLANMQRRAEDLGGLLQITSEPGKGTQLNIWLPNNSASGEAC